MATEWVTYVDMAAGQVVLEVDETAIRVLGSRSAEAKQIHLSQLTVRPSGPDRKGRHQFVLSAEPHDAIRVNLFPDAAGVGRIQVWLDAVARARAALRPPLA